MSDPIKQQFQVFVERKAIPWVLHLNPFNIGYERLEDIPSGASDVLTFCAAALESPEQHELTPEDVRGVRQLAFHVSVGLFCTKQTYALLFRIDSSDSEFLTEVDELLERFAQVMGVRGPDELEAACFRAVETLRIRALRWGHIGGGDTGSRLCPQQLV